MTTTMTTHHDDTLLDTIAGQVRAHPPLRTDEVAGLLARVEHPGDEPSTRLVEHHLGVALDAAIARASPGVELCDLFQEGSAAIVASVAAYAASGGHPAGLREHVRVAVLDHLDEVVTHAQAQRLEEEAFVRDSRVFEAVEVELRHRLGRDATAPEIADLLGWSVERVELLGAMLAEARRLHDENLLPFLDDAAVADGDDEADEGDEGDGTVDQLSWA